MKKIMFMIASAVLMLAGTVEAKAQTDGIKFSEAKTFADVKNEAVKAGKPIFMDVYTTWCPPCKFLSSKIFPTKLVGDYMNATFVNVKMDAEKGEGITLAKRYEVKNYPTMLILNSKGEVLGRLVGSSRTPEDFVKRIKEEMVKINSKK